MSFQKALFNALNTNPLLKKSIFGRKNLISVTVPAKIAENLAYVQAYGNISATYPYYYEITQLDSFCLICTHDGEGLLKVSCGEYIMKKNTIAFIDCGLRHRVEIRKSPWNYKILFISGPPVRFFYNSLVHDGGNLQCFLPGSSIPDKIERLYDFLFASPDEPIIHSKFISDILFEMLLEKNRMHDENSAVADCIYKIKHDFDCRYTENITLEYLERKYHISRYHICREFIKRFHISPIKYLNHRKIEAAKEALLNTDKKIVEIGRMVGFENPNNFIRNFKKCTGITPLEYRRQFFCENTELEPEGES
ncbi:transcriptional regulator, AraC family [Thermoclostridium stercorarium subsp. stercorarium DSM 8532]|uniref:Transcriptional regulator, AraC family n=3 Tax=Thermoclostridium stercorarium TaxID=1510 RepID=L7VL79_THES1|nr:helix-turn-helix transcriptional regulator [Thermoclostridium stercorarium]AGC67492.1 transcriptional regulator, AraC family [Thermoclostridium stercorarium subsp. stercorarium DSM 8532]AGI38547.1 DNA-binding domain-containing protein [Thermoclostridium stercorarium subsp. stercorarium DSM 8532]ANW97920.1 AraC family transcriptional regulator [Thermoclostridium stercorarium subsp. thermolacticum DSM 2910]ANX00470.1 AraC family transcriptional regulator [Thermoclostridium stercorarium subsp. 